MGKEMVKVRQLQLKLSVGDAKKILMNVKMRKTIRQMQSSTEFVLYDVEQMQSDISHLEKYVPDMEKNLCHCERVQSMAGRSG